MMPTSLLFLPHNKEEKLFHIPSPIFKIPSSAYIPYFPSPPNFIYNKKSSNHTFIQFIHIPVLPQNYLIDQMSNTCAKHLDIKFEEPNPKKWSHPLREDVFVSALMGKEHYRPGSLFSPLLFGKFFDPADAFPLWEFEPDSLLPAAPRSADWHQTDAEHVLRAEIPGLQNVDMCIENGKILEISGQYQREASRTKDWKCGKWWEHGCVRRLELPDQIDWRRAEARIDNETTSLEVRIPKQTASGSADA